jgi:hypothetical protein
VVYFKKASILFFFTLCLIRTTHACEDWFQSLKIKDSKSCESKCRTSQTDMATYLCPQQCDLFCKNQGKPIEKDSNFYDLTDNEIAFCKKNPISCAQAYKLSWEAEKICQSIYIRSSTNDESDACRHYIWAYLLAKELGKKTALKILDAHEDNPKQALNEREMDLHNNELGLNAFQKNKNLPNSALLELYKKNLKDKKVKIVKPKYPSTGGLP